MPPAKGKISRALEILGSTDLSIRVDAGLLFCSQQITLEELAEHERYRHIPLETLKNWAVQDGWRRKRKDFIDKWTQTAMKRLGSELAQARIREYKQLEILKDSAHDLLMAEVVKPKSWEGLARTRLDIGKRMDELAGAVISEVLPQQEQTTQEAAVADVQLTEEQKQELVGNLLRIKREQRQIGPSPNALAPIGLEDEDDSAGGLDDDDPPRRGLEDPDTDDTDDIEEDDADDDAEADEPIETTIEVESVEVGSGAEFAQEDLSRGVGGPGAGRGDLDVDDGASRNQGGD